MNKRTIFTILLAATALARVCLAQVSPTDVSQTQMQFGSWGFSARIPIQSVRQSVAPAGDIVYEQIFVSGQYAYVVKITKIPADMLASTFIELAIQSGKNSAPEQSAKRWQLQSKQGDLFKGLTRPLDPETASFALIRKLLKNDPGVQSVAMVPLKDERSPVLSIGVITASNLRQEGYNQAVGIVTFLEFKRGGAPPGVTATKPTASAPTAAKPKPLAPKTNPAPRRKLGKGEIDLLGVVDSVNEADMSLEMTVDHIRMPGKSVIPRDPPASKHVILKSIPGSVKPGARISVVGKNGGIGAPITADFIDLDTAGF